MGEQRVTSEAIAAELEAELSLLESRARSFQDSFALAQKGRSAFPLHLSLGLFILAVGIGLIATAAVELPNIEISGRSAEAALAAFRDAANIQAHQALAKTGWVGWLSGAVGGTLVANALSTITNQRRIVRLKQDIGRDVSGAIADLAHRIDLSGSQAAKTTLGPRLEELQEKMMGPAR